jgi:hypothetical protein
MSLERYFPFLKRDLSVSKDRIIKDLATNKIMVSTVVHACVMYDIDSGEVMNF